jgi:hypothetical protein
MRRRVSTSYSARDVEFMDLMIRTLLRGEDVRPLRTRVEFARMAKQVQKLKARIGTEEIKEAAE